MRRGPRLQGVDGLRGRLRSRAVWFVAVFVVLVMTPVYADHSGPTQTSGIANGAVTTPKIANKAVTTSKVAPRAINTSRLAPSAVKTSRLAPGAVKTSRLSDGAVTTDKIRAGAVGADQIDPTAVQARVTGQCASQAFIHAIAESGFITCRTVLAGDGLEASEGDLGQREISLAADGVEAGNIAPFAVHTAALQDQAVTEDKVASQAVTSPKIGNGAVTAEKLAAVVTRSGSATSVPANGTALADANCEEGEIALSGFGSWTGASSTSPDLAIQAIIQIDPPQSPPNTEGFRVRAANNTGAAVNFTARVRCLTLGV